MKVKRIILWASSTGLKNLTDYSQFLIADHRNFIFYLFREKLTLAGYDMVLYSESIDVKDDDLLLFWNIRYDSEPFIRSSHKNKHIVLSEPGLTVPKNYENLAIYDDFKKVFTYYDPIVDKKKFIKIFYPNHFPLSFDFVPPHERSDVVMIAGHKKARKSQFKKSELYSKRIDIITWYENNDPLTFKLYGRGWDRYFFTNRILRKLNKYPSITKAVQTNKYRSYAGPVEAKYDILKTAKFNICFENMTNWEGYITEKIFDSFFAGCVPVYLGYNEISKLVPHGCYIDYQQFTSNSDMNAFLKNITDQEYRTYQDNIKEFLTSRDADQFKDETIAEIVISHIIKADSNGQ